MAVPNLVRLQAELPFAAVRQGYHRPAMAGLSFSRVLAPLALIAAVAGVVVVVERSSTSASTPTHTTTAVTHHARHHKRRPHAYTIKPGDTFTVIATRTGLSVTTLEQLNPDLDPQALHTGERLKLTR